MNWIDSKKCSAADAAAMINDGDVLGVSGFTLAGYPKEVPTALAARAEKLHAEGKPFKVTLFSGASTGDSCDGALARAQAVLTQAKSSISTPIWARWVTWCVRGLCLPRRSPL